MLEEFSIHSHTVPARGTFCRIGFVAAGAMLREVSGHTFMSNVAKVLGYLYTEET
jgi:hypothetical protein